MTVAETERPEVPPEEEPRTIALGLDVGGTGMKAALVDITKGEIVSERQRKATPHPASPQAVLDVTKELVEPLREQGWSVAGVGFPVVIKREVALTSANMGEEWRYLDVGETFHNLLGTEVHALNDADAAGLAEVRFGAGRGVQGTVIVVTLGTGVGTSLFVDGKLVPNTELAWVPIRGKPAGERASNKARRDRGMSWHDWAEDVQDLFCQLDRMVWPELIIVGGGASGKAHKWLPFVNCRPAIVPAKLRNTAGIIGAATYAWERSSIRV